MVDFELLAPAGGMDSLAAAVSAGADAIYIGGRFSARSEQAVFDDDTICEAVKYCHLHGVDVHVAVNTLIKDAEFDEAVEYVNFLYKTGVDAVIIQDLGLASVVKKCMPQLVMHASTQMTASTLSGVKKLEELGFSRVVLARELSRDEIEYICKNASAEIEVFVHGALCMSYSGQCLMSSLIGGRSGNRGKCAQPCRLPYEIVSDNGTKRKGYILSPKDLSLADEIKALKSFGVKSLKIEGRLKRPEYVATVVGTLRDVIDSEKTLSKVQKDQLLGAFNRGGFTKGYFNGKLGADMMSGVKPGNIADGVYPDYVLDIVAGKRKKKIPVNIFATLCIGKPLSVKITDCDGNVAYGTSETVAEAAINKPLTDDMLEERLKKLGDTPFECESIYVETDGISTIRAKDINHARRTAQQMLTTMREKRLVQDVCEFEKKQRVSNDFGLTLSCEVRTVEQARAARELNIDTVYGDNIEKLSSVPRKEEKSSGESCLIRNVGQWYDNYDKNLYGDYRLNIANSYAVDLLSDMKSLCISPELNLKEISSLSKPCPIEVIAYGKLTLMTMANCPIKAAGLCKKNDKSLRLRDRKNQEFGIICTDNCTAELINSKPIYMADKIDDLKKAGVNIARLVFTDETYDTTKRIIEEYKNALDGNRALPMPENTFTRGHFYRGVI